MINLKNIKKKIIKTRFFICFLFFFLKIYLFTIKIKTKNEEAFLEKLKTERVILCTWHQQFFVLIKAFEKYKKYNPSFIASKSEDGHLTSEISKKVGWNPIRGSSHKGGTLALMKIIKKLKKNKLALHIVDGPRGPIGKVKPGLLSMAKFSNALIIPFYVSASSYYMVSSWDKFIIPKPFSKVTINFDEAIKVDENASKEDFKKKLVFIENKMKPYLLN